MALPGFRLAPSKFAISENLSLTTAPCTQCHNWIRSTVETQEIYRSEIFATRVSSSLCDQHVRHTRTRYKFINLTRQSAFGALHHLESQFARHSLRASSPLILGELQEIAREETQGAVSLTAPFACHKWREQVITGCKT